MSRARRIRFRGEAAGHASAVALLESPGDAALDRRGVPRAIVMKCPDGCGDILTVNLDPRAGKAWRADNRGGKLTLYPSVWRDQGCEAHFILWRDWLLWGDTHDEYRWSDDALIAIVRQDLARRGAFVHYETVAESLGAVPWEALWACQALLRRGEAEVQDRNFFQLKPIKKNSPRGLLV